MEIIIDGATAKSIRKKMGLNQTDFWTPLGVTQSGASRYEAGRDIPKPTQILVAFRYGKGKAKAVAAKALGLEV